MLYLNLSFDYELFMGENYASEKEVLIEPTNKIIKALANEDTTATFFVDVLCPIRYRELNNIEFPIMVEEQIRDMIRCNQDVQLHIHPHWMFSTKVGNVIEFDRDTYRIHNLIEQYGTSYVDNIIKKGVDYLTNIILPVKPDYRCVAFRSGGYCLQPETQIFDLLYANGIRIDSSMCEGFMHHGDGMEYDYKMFTEHGNYWFNNNISLTTKSLVRLTPGIMEVPVGGFKHFPQRLIASRMNSIISNEPQNGRSMSLTTKQQNNKGLFYRINSIFSASNMLTFDFYSAKSLTYMVKNIKQIVNASNKDVFLSVIAHPKLQSENHVLNMIDFIKSVKQIPNIEFVSMQQIATLNNL